MTTVRIALANLPYPASREAAVEQAVLAVRDAGLAGATIVSFPECYVPGYRTPDRALPPPDPEYLEGAWNAIAGAAGEAGVAVVLGTERIVDGKPRIAALIIDADGTRVGFQDKVQLDPSEEPFFTAATERQLFEVGPLKFGVSICHEGWRYPETVRWAARRGAQVVFHPHFHEADATSFRPSEFADPRNTFHEKAMLCRAAENTIWFASVNCAGDGSPTTSAFIRPDGTVHSWQPYGKAGLLVADLDLDAATGLLASRARDR